MHHAVGAAPPAPVLARVPTAYAGRRAAAFRYLHVDYAPRDTWMEPVCACRDPAYTLVCVFARYVGPTEGCAAFEAGEPDERGASVTYHARDGPPVALHVPVANYGAFALEIARRRGGVA